MAAAVQVQQKSFFSDVGEAYQEFQDLKKAVIDGISNIKTATMQQNIEALLKVFKELQEFHKEAKDVLSDMKNAKEGFLNIENKFKAGGGAFLVTLATGVGKSVLDRQGDQPWYEDPATVVLVGASQVIALASIYFGFKTHGEHKVTEGKLTKLTEVATQDSFLGAASSTIAKLQKIFGAVKASSSENPGQQTRDFVVKETNQDEKIEKIKNHFLQIAANQDNVLAALAAQIQIGDEFEQVEL